LIDPKVEHFQNTSLVLAKAKMVHMVSNLNLFTNSDCSSVLFHFSRNALDVVIIMRFNSEAEVTVEFRFRLFAKF
jgi:hypothetical protein